MNTNQLLDKTTDVHVIRLRGYYNASLLFDYINLIA